MKNETDFGMAEARGVADPDRRVVGDRGDRHPQAHAMKLNTMQQEAVGTTARQVAVVASPGSGKTAVIVHRVAKLVGQGRRVAVVTLTNSAADEIRLRLAAMPGDPQPWYCGTIHGLAYRVIGMPKVAVLGQEDGDILTIEAQRRVDYKGSQRAFDVALRNLLQTGYVVGSQDVTTAIRSWIQMQSNGGVMTFDGLLYFAAEHLRNTEATGLHLVVDEGQDCAAVDFRIFQLLKPDSTFIVGDPDQAIFGFRGGDLRAFLAYVRARETQVFNLPVTYRCSPGICATADRLIAHNDARVPKAMVPASIEELPLPVEYLPNASQSQELAAIVDWYHDRLGESSFAIICRTNEVVDMVRKALGFRWNPYYELPKDWCRVRRMLAAMLCPTNDWLVATAFSLDPGKLLANCRASQTPASVVLFGCNPPTGRIQALNWLAVRVSQESIHHLNSIWTDGDLTPEVLIQLDQHCVGLGPEVSVVTTIHKAKGREFDHVWIPFLDEEQYRGDAEELRRMLYVAVTRARKSVTVSWSETRSVYGSVKAVKPSAMVEEMKP